MDNKTADQNYGQQATTINNRAVNFWPITPLSPKKKLMRQVPLKFRSMFKQALKTGDQTATEIIVPIESKAIVFRENEVASHFSFFDRLCFSFFASGCLVCFFLILNALIRNLLPHKQVELMVCLILTIVGEALIFWYYILPQDIAKRFMKTLQAMPDDAF